MALPAILIEGSRARKRTMSQTKEEIVLFLKERSIFRVLNEKVLAGITQLFEKLHCGPGHIVFKQGDEADAIYVILDGSVEVLEDGHSPKVLAYLTSGDCFGEMGIIHDSLRNATVRVPEEAVLLKLPRKAFEELQTYFPEITREVTEVINRRLSGKLPISTPGLQGNLAFFDLPTVIQTVVGSRQTGILKLSGRAGKPVADVAVRAGKIVYARFLHLTGEHAIYELLTRAEPLDFVFDQRRDLDPSISVDKTISEREPYKLLMEGARRSDELPKLLRALEWPGGVPLRGTKTPDWSKVGEETAAVGKKLWLLVEVGLNVKNLADKLPYDRYTILGTLEELKAQGLIKGKYAKSEEIEAPVSVAPIFGALNQVTTGLSLILGKDQVRAALTQALAYSSKKHPLLASLKIHPETATLDLRSAAPEVSQSKTSRESLEDLTSTFLKLASQLPLPSIKSSH
jgi:CRP-like cAMP-binding protein